MNAHPGLAWSAAVAAIAASIVSTVLIRRRRDPREKERRRRELVNVQGRVIEGYVTACANHIIEYSYHWRGVRYEASQDLSDLTYDEAQFDDFCGPATVKFLPSRPVDSIIIAERWTGIPGVRQKATSASS
jgi:hypothetical protein